MSIKYSKKSSCLCFFRNTNFINVPADTFVFMCKLTGLQVVLSSSIQTFILERAPAVHAHNKHASDASKHWLEQRVPWIRFKSRLSRCRGLYNLAGNTLRPGSPVFTVCPVVMSECTRKYKLPRSTKPCSKNTHLFTCNQEY